MGRGRAGAAGPLEDVGQHAVDVRVTRRVELLQPVVVRVLGGRRQRGLHLSKSPCLNKPMDKKTS